MQRFLMNRKYQQPSHIYVIWEFSYKILPLYLWNHVWSKPFVAYPAQSTSKTITEPHNYPYYDDDSDAVLQPVESLVHNILEFLSILTSIPQIQNALKISIHHLTNLLFHFMLMTENDSKGWNLGLFENPIPALGANAIKTISETSTLLSFVLAKGQTLEKSKIRLDILHIQSMLQHTS